MNKTSMFKTIVIVGCAYCAGISLIAGAALAAMYKPIVEAIWTDETDDE